jgi:hypothetical protein
MRIRLLRLLVLGCVCAAWPQNARAEKFALIFGISGYPQYEPNQRLQFADDDARAFATFVASPQGGSFPADNVHLVVNDDATRSRLFKELNWLSTRVRGDDTVYVFFAGHGQPDTNNRVYLMPFDADPRLPENLGLRADEFLRILREKVTAENVLLFIDACYSGAAYEADGRARSSPANTTSEISSAWRVALSGRTGRGMNVAFMSAAANQLSWEDPEFGHGLFTYYLLEGLRGNADRSKDGIVTLSEIGRYVTDNVESRSELKFGSQTPRIMGSSDQGFPMAVLSNRTERAAEPIAATGRFEAITLSIGNHPLDWLIEPPNGPRILGGIPFRFGSGASATFATRAHYQPSHPAVASLTVDVPQPLAVHVLASGAWASHVPTGEELGRIVLGFEGGRSLEVPLINGQNLRETWEYERSLTSSGPTTNDRMQWRNVLQEGQIRGSDPNRDQARAYLDLISIRIPPELQSTPLRRIEFRDTDHSYKRADGAYVDPSIVVTAVTVEQR